MALEKLIDNQLFMTPQTGDGNSTILSHSQVENLRAQQISIQLSNRVRKLTKSCYTLGIISLVLAIIMVVSLFSGLFTSDKASAVGPLILLGMMYFFVAFWGTILMIATLTLAIRIKARSHTPIKKPLIAVLGSALLIYVPLGIASLIVLIVS